MMQLFDRFVGWLATLALMFTAFLTVLLAFRLLPLHYLGTSVSYLYGRFDLGVVFLLILLASVRLFLVNMPRRVTPPSIAQEGELGTVAISLTAVENLVQRIVLGVRGVKDSKTVVTDAPGGVKILVKVIMGPDLPIPTVAQELQELVYQKVDEIMGLTVVEVVISIDNIGPESRTRVQ